MARKAREKQLDVGNDGSSTLDNLIDCVYHGGKATDPVKGRKIGEKILTLVEQGIDGADKNLTERIKQYAERMKSPKSFVPDITGAADQIFYALKKAGLLGDEGEDA